MSISGPSGEPPKKKRIWIWVCLPLCLLLLLAGGAAAYFHLSERKSDAPPKEVPKEEELVVAHDKTTVLIMGIDERTEDVGRTDTLMLAMLDPETDRAALLSIPRDTRVRIKGHGFDKINAAYAYGKVPLAERTVEEFLGVEVNHYLIIDTKAFVKVIDAIGGVDIQVEERMYYEDPWDDDGGLLIDFQPGLQHMDGHKAITYVRYRDFEGDAGRIRRQQAFMRACMAKLMSPSILASLPTVVQEIASSVRTDLTIPQLLELAGSLKLASRHGLDVGTVPGEYEYIGGICYLLPNIQKLRTTVANTLGIQMSKDLSESFERAARDYEDSLPPPSSRTPAPRENTEDYAPRSRQTAPAEQKAAQPKTEPASPEPRPSEEKTSEDPSSGEKTRSQQDAEPAPQPREPQEKEDAGKPATEAAEPPIPRKDSETAPPKAEEHAVQPAI